jgi:predicted nucleic acid-binding protein
MTTNRYSQPNAASFLPVHTTKVIERTTEVIQSKEGSTIRRMTEVIVYELNPTLISDLMSENQALKYQLENTQKTGFWTAENITGFSLSGASLLWSILK